MMRLIRQYPILSITAIVLYLLWFFAPTLMMVVPEVFQASYRHQLPKPQWVAQAKGPYVGTVVYLIHLDSAVKRLKKVQPILRELHLPFNIIHAVAGSKLPPKFIATHVDQQKWYSAGFTQMYLGAIGCSLSHYQALRQFLASHYRYAVIFEDDVVFYPSDVISALKALTAHSQLWDLVNLEYSEFDPQHHSALHMAYFPEIKRHLNYATKFTWGSGAYVVNRRAAKRILATSFPITMPLDYHIRQDWELGIVTAEIHPILAKTVGVSLRLNSPEVPFDHFADAVTNPLLYARARSCYRDFYHMVAWLKVNFHQWVQLSLHGV